MRICLHIGPEVAGAARIQGILADKRDQLRAKGVLFPRSPGNQNHTRLFMAATDPDHVDPLRFNRGYADPGKQAALRDEVGRDLAREIEQARPDLVILSAAQLISSVHRRSELDRLRDMLSGFSDDISVLALVDDPARLALAHYAHQLAEGRGRPMERDLALADAPDWWQACLSEMPAIDPVAGRFEETDGAPFWLDFTALRAFWDGAFGAGSTRFVPYDPQALAGPEAPDHLRGIFGIGDTIGRATPDDPAPPVSAATLTRWRAFNATLHKLLATRDRVVPRQLWHRFLAEMTVDGPPPDPGALRVLSDRFADSNATLAAEFCLPENTLLAAPDPAPDWSEADPQFGFRATQYLLSCLYRIDKASKQQFDTLAGPVLTPPGTVPAAKSKKNPGKDPGGLSDAARSVMPPLAIEKYEGLRNSSFAPHNKLGAVDEEQLAAAYAEAPMRPLPDGRTGNVIVGCMKNEAPYIVEWVAYHRAMGVDDFLIYTNDCSDGTSEILDRLQQMGVLQHRNNDDWKGNSPQQFALNQALKEPVIRNSDWIIHIDVDEFINVRCGNGTLADFFDRVPDATNVAMTWRLFGHNDVTRLEDRFVIEQFDACAPKYCPKPHTVWGFKTMFRNIGAYEKLSCHRPNKLDDALRDKVRWVNGSGQDMTREAVDNGWRNSKKSIGYDLIQLNHYALRSAESFLIKRQRGRALHVDRSIGLNYWIRMDWCDYRDVTIKRNLPRLRGEYDRLMQDDQLRYWHNRGLDWHRTKAQELHAMPEFEDLYQQALRVKLTGTERVAYALALDMES